MNIKNNPFQFASQRTHDLFYLKENKGQFVKEYFKKIGSLISHHIKSEQNKVVRIADIGCATGELLSYINTLVPDADLYGFDVVQELIEEARKRHPSIKFDIKSILDKKSIDQSSFDIVTCNGVISLFDDTESVLSNLLSWTKNNGKLIIHGLFNPHDVDVFIRYRNAGNLDSNVFECGWNLISIDTVGKILRNKLNISTFTFHKFEIPFDVKKNVNDPLRSWTEKRDNGLRFITNGLSIIQNQYTLEITKK